MSLRTIKDKLHYFLVQKNDAICNEYVDYRNKNEEKHLNERYKTWILILKLNLKYRILRNQSPKIQNKRKVKLPYLDGAESEVYKRQSEYHFAQSLLNYDVISFDIFDTLVLRPFAKPHDMFIIVGERLDYMNFAHIRREAEKEARKTSMDEYGHHEVSIYDIYEIVERETGINKEYGVKVEFETELEFCFANPYMMRVFNILKEQGKDIIITSDMYLPHELMEKLLKKCGYSEYKKLYVSCDYNANKRNGILYEKIIENIGKDKKVVHIGDNYDSDIKSAQGYGIDTRYYKNVHDIGNRYRADGMSALIGSIYSGIVNTHLHNGTKQYNSYYEYGFIYGGLYVLGYCNWIYEKSKNEGIDKILFLSRDGEIYKKVFDMMYTDIPSEYVYWSRIANCKYASKFQRNDIISRIVKHRASSITKKTIKSLFDDFNLNKLESKLESYNLEIDMIIDKGNINQISKLLSDNWNVFIESYETQRNILKEYFQFQTKECKKIAIVDVGWVASGPLGIKSLIKNEWKLNCEVICLVAGHMSHLSHDSGDTNILNKTVQSYIFSTAYNRNHYDIHRRTNKGLNCMNFELFTQAMSPSFSGIKDNGDYEFDIPEVENYKIINDIHQGIIDFSEIYIKKFGEEKYTLNISGYDAYCPFRMIIRNMKFIKSEFNNFLFARGIIGNTEEQKFETLGQMIDQCNL